MRDSLYVKSVLAYVGLGYLSASATPPPALFFLGQGLSTAAQAGLKLTNIHRSLPLKGWN